MTRTARGNVVDDHAHPQDPQVTKTRRVLTKSGPGFSEVSDTLSDACQTKFDLLSTARTST